jgi:hypothetical protein
MLFRTSDGNIKEINRFDCNNDFIYYKKVMDVKKDFLKNSNTVEKEKDKKKDNPLSAFLQKSSK